MSQYTFSIPLAAFDSRLVPTEASAGGGFPPSASRWLEKGFESIGCSSVVRADACDLTAELSTGMDYQQLGRKIIETIDDQGAHPGLAMLRLWAVPR